MIKQADFTDIFGESHHSAEYKTVYHQKDLFRCYVKALQQMYHYTGFMCECVSTSTYRHDDPGRQQKYNP